MPELHGSTFTLRPYRPDDAEALTRAANNPNIARNMGRQFSNPYTVEIARKWIASCQERFDGGLHFAIDVDGVVFGGIGTFPISKWSPYTFEMGYWLAESHWGHGIATEAVKLWVPYCFDTFDARRLQAFVYDWNPASARVLEKNSFTLEGRLRSAVHLDGRTGDCLAYGRLR